MFSASPSLPEDLLARLKQYDVTIVPIERSQVRHPPCVRIPEETSKNEQFMFRHRLCDDQQKFQRTENIKTHDFHSCDVARNNWYQSENRNEYMTSLLESQPTPAKDSGIQGHCGVYTSDDEKGFCEYRPCTQQKLQESTPRRKVRTEEITNPSFQHCSNDGRFQKVISSKLMGRDAHFEPKPRKRLRFDDITSGNLPDTFQPIINRKNPFEYVRYGYDNEEEKILTKCSNCENITQYNSHLPNRNVSPISSVRFRQFPAKLKRSRTDGTTGFEDAQSGSNKCACVAMEQCFVNMAERAYRNIRRRDATPGGFSQFLVEINTTNDLLRQTLSVLKSIRNMCDHVCRS